jgi:transcriptional regulator of acetoin/glycerol metabolism
MNIPLGFRPSPSQKSYFDILRREEARKIIQLEAAREKELDADYERFASKMTPIKWAERELMVRYLRTHQFQTVASARIGMSRRTFIVKIKEYEITDAEWKH